MSEQLDRVYQEYDTKEQECIEVSQQLQTADNPRARFFLRHRYSRLTHELEDISARADTAELTAELLGSLAVHEVDFMAGPQIQMLSGPEY
jgi:hypothetical protein